MAPILHRRVATGPPTWAIVVAVIAAVGVSALTCLGVYLIVFRFRDRQYRDAARRDPYLTRKEWARRRKLSVLQRIEEEEVQRQLILRKTLTSRTSSRNDFRVAEGRRGQASVEVTRKESGERREEEDLKKWEAGHGDEVENDAYEGHPLIQEHPAVKAGEQSRSASPTRAPLLRLQEPDSRRFSLWERRQNDDYTPSLRITSDSPSRAPELEHLHIFAPPQQLLHDHPSPRHTRSVDRLQRPSPSERSRAASVDNRNHPIFRSANLFHTRAASNPVTIPLSEIPTSNRARSNSASRPQLTDLISPPPPAALPQSAPLRNDGSLPRDVHQRRASSQLERPLSWGPKKTTHIRTRSHEMLSSFRNASPSPAQSPRRKPVPTRALSSVSSTGSLATTAASMPPTVSPVEEAALERERSTVRPDGDTLLSDEAFSVVRGDIEALSASDRDGLPSQMHQNLHLDPAAPAPLQRINRTSTADTAETAEDAQPVFSESRSRLEELGAPRSDSPVQLEPSPNRLSVPVPTPAQANRANAGGDEEVGTAFSFEVGDHIKERNISVRQLEPQDPTSPDESLVVYGPENATVPDTAGPLDTGTSFSFEIGDHLKELNISRRNPPQRDTPSPIDSLASSSLHSNADHVEAAEQEEGTFDFEEESQLKELGMSSRNPPPKRRSSPLAQLDIPRSPLDKEGSSTGTCLTPEEVARRLPVVQGKWELQVSMLDQTGARHSRGSRDDDSDFYSSASEPASPEEENTFDAEIPAPGAGTGAEAGGGFLAPVNTAPARTLPMRPTAPRDVSHARTPSTPMTSPEIDPSLCRANFASPAKEKMLSEKGFSPRSPPMNLPRFHSPSPVSPPLNYTVSPTSPPIRSIPVFAPPHSASEWSASSEGLGVRERRRDTETVESDYGSDTMKQTFGSGAVPVAMEKGQVSSRLSGPPDFMPAFF